MRTRIQIEFSLDQSVARSALSSSIPIYPISFIITCALARRRVHCSRPEKGCSTSTAIQRAEQRFPAPERRFVRSLSPTLCICRDNDRSERRHCRIELAQFAPQWETPRPLLRLGCTPCAGEAVTSWISPRIATR